MGIRAGEQSLFPGPDGNLSGFYAPPDLEKAVSMQMKLFLPLLFLLASGCTTVTESAPEPTPPFVGSYIGKVYDGGIFSPVETTFAVSKDGHLTGRYAMQTEAGVEQGNLTDLRRQSEYSLSMHWEDRFGDGILRVLFSEDFNTFIGFWGSETTPASLPWGGKRNSH